MIAHSFSDINSLDRTICRQAELLFGLDNDDDDEDEDSDRDARAAEATESVEGEADESYFDPE
jgi:hypothetical protein